MFESNFFNMGIDTKQNAVNFVFTKVMQTQYCK